MSRVVHFEIATPDPAAAERFFSDVFGWRTQEWSGGEDYRLVFTGQEGEVGIDGAIMRAADGRPATVNSLAVESVDRVIERVTEAGGSVIAPKTAVPGVGWLAYCADPTGVTFGIFERDPGAA